MPRCNNKLLLLFRLNIIYFDLRDILVMMLFVNFFSNNLGNLNLKFLLFTLTFSILLPVTKLCREILSNSISGNSGTLNIIYVVVVFHI